LPPYLCSSPDAGATTPAQRQWIDEIQWEDDSHLLAMVRAAGARI
jgi:hypothetical protein